MTFSCDLESSLGSKCLKVEAVNLTILSSEIAITWEVKTEGSQFEASLDNKVREALSQRASQT
jgi:hypothetical protein